MEKNKEITEEKPPFFKAWKGLYAFILIVELVLILLFILMTNSYSI